MPFFAYPSFSKALHRPKGVRIGEFEAKRRKYVNFLDFDFSENYDYMQKKRKITKKKSSADFLNRCSQPFGLTKLIC